jgi:hypothetical protein
MTEKNLAPQSPSISGEEIKEEVFRRLERYDNLSLLEHYAMFMGKAQILEFGLKNLLVRLYNYDWDTIERWTLGKTCKQLEKSGLRGDFIQLLESVVEYRNYIAHEFLVNDALLRMIMDADSSRLETKHLQKGTFELEQLIFIYHWTNERDLWM